MWPPPNIHALPSKEEIRRAKEEISTIELEIVEAQLRLDALKKSVVERKAWIAPIRRIPHEILSQTFTEASRTNWKAPLVLQGVSRRWRHVVMDSPEAWSFIPLTNCSSVGKFQIISLFLERSRNTPLHVYVKDRFLLGHTEELESRVKCIHLNVTRFVLEEYLQCGGPFHRMHTLRIESEYPVGDTPPTAAWDMFLFPNLKVLDIVSISSSLLRAISAAPEFPAIRHLTLNGSHWKLTDILTKCAESVESVDLKYQTWRSEGLDAENKIHFPRLRYLRLMDLSDQEGSRFYFKATTPNLQAHFDQGDVSTTDTVRVDTGNVKILHTLRTPDLSRYPRLVTLCFGGKKDQGAELGKAIEWLRDHPDICPDLELIEYTEGLTPEQFTVASSALLIREKITRQMIQLMKRTLNMQNERAQKERAHMYRELEPCGYHLPCKYHNNDV